LSDRDQDEDGVEELGDEIIVAQQTDAHAPAPRAMVTTDHPSVVISGQQGLGKSSPPGTSAAFPTVPPMRRAERMEKTVVIRDRKSLDRLRREASRRPRKKRRPWSRTLALVGAAVLASLAAGTLLAALANSSGSDEQSRAAASAEVVGPSVAPTPSQAAPEVVDLEDLPVVKKKKKKKSGE
jgi:hypothetical protein